VVGGLDGFHEWGPIFLCIPEGCVWFQSKTMVLSVCPKFLSQIKQFKILGFRGEPRGGREGA
jgi:hypothetical protein